MAFTFEEDSGIDFDALFNPNTPSLFDAAPTMAEPAHPGDLMREIIDEWGVTITDAAKVMGLQRTHLSAMLSGDKPVSIETAIKFEAAFGGPAPTVVHSMSDLYESAKALRRKDELVANIVRMSEVTAAALKNASKGRKKVAEAA
jgi:addiction module HigA family antidote